MPSPEEFEMAAVEARNLQVPISTIGLMRQAAACYEQTVENINVIDSEDVHVGPRFISIAQNVQNVDIAKGHIQGLELVSQQNTKRLRCGVAVFVCWTLIVTTLLMVFVLYFALAKTPSRMDLDIYEPWYIRRNEWYANTERCIDLLELPVRLVLVGHSALDFCTKKYDCIQNVLNIQKLHIMDNRWEDIGPNFLVGGPGLIFEGRGANILGAMVKSFNYKSISIMFLGNYLYDEPAEAMFSNLKALFKELVKKRVLAPDYVVYGQCQVVGGIVQPGPNVMDNLYRFEHWNPANKSSCIRS